MARPRAILLDDDNDITAMQEVILQAIGLDCEVHNEFATFRQSDLSQVNLMLLDLAMPGRDGLEVLSFLEGQKAKMPILLVSSMSESVLRAAESVGHQRGLNIAGWMRKPFWPEELGKRVEKIVRAPVDNLLTNAELEKLLNVSGGIVVEYLPRVNVQWHQFDGLKALVRLRHSEHGLIRPGAFLPQLEGTALMQQLTRTVLLRVFRDMTSWMDWDMTPRVSVNVDLQSVADDQLVDWVDQTAGQFQISPERLQFDLTGLSPMSINAEILSGMTRLRIKEVGLAMSNIGHPIPSTTFLTSLPIEEVRLDRSLTSRMSFDAQARACVEEIIQLAGELSLRTVADGFETMEQSRVASQLGIDVAQGHYFSRAVGAAQVPAVLSTKPSAY